MSSPSRKPHVPVAILGAGLTGLSAALACQQHGVTYRLFERLPTVGGLASTVVDSGFRFDKTGHLLHLRDAELKSDVLGWLEGECRVIHRVSRIWSHGVYTKYPYQANTYGLPVSVAYQCVMGYLKARDQKTGATPKNFEEYCRMHFGDGFSDHFMLPYNRRLWGVAPDEITTQWCERFVPEPKLQDVIAGALGASSRELGYNREFLYPRGGIGSLSQALKRQVRCLELGRTPDRLDLERKELSFGDQVVGYDTLISSIPLPDLVRLCKRLPDEVSRAAQRLRFTHLYYLDVALSAPCRQDWHWAYVPEAKYPFYRVGCYSNFSDELAPRGSSSLYVELVDRSPPELESLLPEVARALVEMGVIKSSAEIQFARVRRIDHAYVIFDHAYSEVTTRIHAFLREHAVQSTGRYGGWTYSSMEDALLDGRRAVRAVLE